ncbi:MAG: hypothetical protein AMXMBFR66_03320 [Pseudomonadota bacterium]|nr:hypothetical protein [Rubrivivax sp.]
MPPDRALAAALVACVGLLGAAPACADSSASSAIAHSASASVGSLSTSLENSSDSSNKGRDVAAGDYRIVEVAAAPERAGGDGGDARGALMRLRLAAVAGSGAAGEFFLYVPQAALELGGIAVGQRLRAQARPYGIEFAQGETGRAFFLLLADEWYRELRTRPVAG